MAEEAHRPAQEAEWLNLTQAARKLGWSRDRLRSLARRERLTTRRSNDGQLLVLLDAELVATAAAEPRPGKPTSEQPGGDETAQGLRDRVAELEDQVANLRVDLARAEERARAIEAVARNDVESAQRVAEAEIEANEQLLAELRATIAWYRRPWWRRWLGLVTAG